MAGRSGWPKVYRDLCPPIRMCTSWLADCPSGHPADHSIVRRSSRTLKTASVDTMDIRTELRAQIFFPRQAQLSSRFTLIGGTTNAKANSRRIIELRTLHHTENTLPTSGLRKGRAEVYTFRAASRGEFGSGKAITTRVRVRNWEPVVICFAERRDRIWRYLVDGEFFGETRNAGTCPPPLVTLARPVALRRVR